MFYSECQPGNQIVPPPAPGQGRTGRTAPSTTTPVPREARQTRKVRPAGIEPAACGLKDRCSLAPRREPLTTELRARAGNVYRLNLLGAPYLSMPGISMSAPVAPSPRGERARGAVTHRALEGLD